MIHVHLHSSKGYSSFNCILLRSHTSSFPSFKQLENWKWGREIITPRITEAIQVKFMAAKRRQDLSRQCANPRYGVISSNYGLAKTTWLSSILSLWEYQLDPVRAGGPLIFQLEINCWIAKLSSSRVRNIFREIFRVVNIFRDIFRVVIFWSLIVHNRNTCISYSAQYILLPVPLGWKLKIN